MAVKSYRKKPVIIEAIQWKEPARSKETMQWVNAHSKDRIAFTKSNVNPFEKIYIKTLEGEHEASLGDFIIKGVKGEFYPCKPDIFEMTYEELTEEL